jgi:hypothetical protein
MAGVTPIVHTPVLSQPLCNQTPAADKLTTIMLHHSLICLPLLLTPFYLTKERERVSLAVGLYGKDYRHAVVFV